MAQSDKKSPTFKRVKGTKSENSATIVPENAAVLTTTPFGILAYGLLLALTGALIDEKLIQKINDKIFN
ncbi:colicin-like pore-forming protein [Serratia proteamaculans]|uniref:colicin-like pore-forming protein n=1 Tax=Serratia proteamaculans TaxID=28151 RepID=UPI0021B7D45A|nr:colicin-like pore-forming protein [Serratia proteamaculans]